MSQSQVVEELYNSYAKSAANIISYCEGEERKKMLQELRSIVETNCIQDKKLKRAQEEKERILGLHKDAKTETDIEGIIREYKTAMSEIDVDVSQDEKLIEFDKQVKALLQFKGETDNADDTDDDEDIHLTGNHINVIDPITKKRMVNPVKNTICGHTYDKDAITQLLQANKNTRCPVVGCKSNDFVILSNLRFDIVTKTYLDQNPAK